MNRNRIATGICCIALLCGCSITSGLLRHHSAAGLAQLSRVERTVYEQDYRPQIVKLQRDSNSFLLVPTDTLVGGERVMSVNIEQVTVTSRVRSLPERKGKVTIDFVVTFPKEMLGRSRSIVITPYLHKQDEAEPLQDLTIRGGLFNKVQERDYWQYDTYLWRFDPDSLQAERVFRRLVKYPYPEDVRLDSIIENRRMISYFYSQAVATDEASKKMLITLQGKVTGLDESSYNLPSTDTLTYLVSSMLSFVDTTTRYKIKIIEKYATIQDRNYIQFLVNDTRVLDTLGQNDTQLQKIEHRMAGLIGQQEFFVDSVVLTASASPEGSFVRNRELARGRAYALKRYLRERIGSEVDTLVRVRWVAEDWQELAARIRDDESLPHRAGILELIEAEKDPDSRERIIRERYPKEYQEIKAGVYPWLRAVTMRYDLRRRGMIKDTIQTLEVDSNYMRGVGLLQKRKYAKALYILNDYQDINTAVVLLSLGYDTQALEIIGKVKQSAVTEYLKAVACSRLGRKTEGREHFLRACDMDERMQYRANLDPEITELLKN